MVFIFKKKKHTHTHTQTYQIHNYVFSYTETCYLKYDTKHIFFFMNTVNTCFHNTF